MAIQLSDNISIGQKKPIDDRQYNNLAPYTNTTEVNATIPSGKRYVGLTVHVVDPDDNTKTVEYHYQGGIANGNLVLKTQEFTIPTPQQVWEQQDPAEFSVNIAEDITFRSIDAGNTEMTNLYLNGSEGRVIIAASQDIALQSNSRTIGIGVTGITLNAGAGGSISTDDSEGINIQGNAGGVTIQGSSLGVTIDGQGGNAEIRGGAGGLILDGQSGGTTFRGGSYSIENHPFNYSADFSSEYTDRSLVDKGYINSVLIDLPIPPAQRVFEQPYLDPDFAVNVEKDIVIQSTFGSDYDKIVLQPSDEGTLLESTKKVSMETPNHAVTVTTLRTQMFADAGTLEFNVDGTAEMLVIGNPGNFKGVQYNADYSAQYVNRSLVDKAYVDSLAAAVFRPAGNYDASVGTFPTTGTGTAGIVRRGDTYKVSVAGTLGGESYDIGDNFYAVITSPGQTSTNWARFEANTNQATSSYRGTVRLYNTTGTNTDGGVDQNTYTSGLALKSNLNSPTFTGVPAAPTATAGTNTTQLATTAFATTAANAKVTQTITDGVTTTAPSEDAVFDALGLKGNLSGGNTWAGTQTYSNDIVRTGNSGFVYYTAGTESWVNGASTSYVRANGTIATFNPEVRGVALVGFATGGNTPITAANSILQAFQNAQGQIDALTPLTASATLDFPSTASGASNDLTITVTGAVVGKPVKLGVPPGSVLTNSSFSAWVSATNTVTVRLNNYSSTSKDPASGTFTVEVTK